METNLFIKLTRNIERLSSLRKKKENLEREIRNLELKISNQQYALEREKEENK